MTSMKSATSRQRENYQIVESLSSPDCYMEPYSSFVAVYMNFIRHGGYVARV